MAGKIFIAEKSVGYDDFGDNDIAADQHLYLVYDADGDPTSLTDQRIIRGGPIPGTFADGNIHLQVDDFIQNSEDSIDILSETSSQAINNRNYTEIVVADAEKAWDRFVETAKGFGTATTLGTKTFYISSIDYEAFDQNSNSTIGSILSASGISLANNTPNLADPFDPIDRRDITSYVSPEILYSGHQKSTQIVESYIEKIVDGTGANTYYININESPDDLVFDKTYGGGIDQIYFDAVVGMDTIEIVQDDSDLILRIRNSENEIIKEVMLEDAYDTSLDVLNYETIISTPYGRVTTWQLFDYGSPINLNGATLADFAEKIGSGISDFMVMVKTAFNAAEIQTSPLVLDLDGDGVETTSLVGSDAIYFDHDHDGYAEASGWVSADDGILAIDLNSDGIINNGAELFGDQTGYINGFLALAQHDSNHDGKISNADTVWSDLRIWQDTNNDGYSQSGELRTLNDLNITEIDLAYSNSNTTNNGNNIKQIGSFTINGNTNAISDVYFTVDKINSTYAENYELDTRVLFLPTVRGYGTLPDLHIAMSLDNTGTGNLLGLVQNFAAFDASDFFTNDASNVLDAVKAIMFRWAGVDDMDPSSRGNNVDARKLTFLEKLVNEPYLQLGLYSDPMPFAGTELTMAFEHALNKLTAQLAVQLVGNDLFTGNAAYNPVTDVVDGITGLNLTTLADLETQATGLANATERLYFWKNVLRVIDYTVTIDNLSSSDAEDLEDAITGSEPTLSLEIARALIDVPTFTNINGTSGNDTLIGFASNDDLRGWEGNDTLYGLASDDKLTGDDGNDLLVGGVGGDLLQGGSGDDIYSYSAGDGQDFIIEADGSDKILFGSGIDAGDLTFTRYGNDARILIDNGTYTGEIVVSNQFSSAEYGVELIDFNGASSLAFSAINWTTYGTVLNDFIAGVQVNGDNQDLIFAGAGNDTIIGYDGDDILHGDAGHDELQGGNGEDSLYGGDGNDALNGGDHDDYLEGGDGNDVVFGEGGDDIYYYTGGHDIFMEVYYGLTSDPNYGVDEIRVAPGITLGDVTFERYIANPYDIVIAIDNENSIILDQHLIVPSDQQIETLFFEEDNTTVNLLTLSQITTYGSSGDDLVYGLASNDILKGGAGNDSVYGEGGDDVYYYTSGHDVFAEVYYGLTSDPNYGADVIRIAPGITLGDVTFERHISNPSDVVIVIDGENSITLWQHLILPSDQVIETLIFEEDDTTVNILTQQWTTIGTSGDDLIYGLIGDDILKGGAGNDSVYGEGGNDVYYYTSGNDVFAEVYYGLSSDPNYGDDVIRIAPGIILGDVTFERYVGSSANAVIVIDSENSITLHQHLILPSDHLIETLVFEEDDTTIDLLTQQWTLYGTSSGDTMSGVPSTSPLAQDDIMYGLDGNDIISGDDGDDVIYGGDGLDNISGGTGADTFVFEADSAFNDIDVITDFNDTDSDKLDISDLLVGYTPGTSDINDFMSLSVAGSDTTVLIDRDGTGVTYSSQSIATLSSVTGLVVDDLLNNGNLII